MLAKTQNFDRIKELIASKYFNFSEEFVNGYKKHFLNKHKDSLEAIIFYGSCLNETTKKDTSTPDFFLVVNRYSSFHSSISHSILNRIYTPNTYSLVFEGGKGKYNTISFKDFIRETSQRAKDIYNLGRLSKRTAIVYCKNEQAKESLIDALANAYYTVAKKVVYLAPTPFSLSQFVETALRISYIGEKRVEAEDKIEKLYGSERDFYDSVYSLIIEDLLASNEIKPLGKALYEPSLTGLCLKMSEFKTRFFLKKSVLRAKLRWPKSMYTFKGWVDVLLAKIERTKGIKIELSEKERKYPLIYGWKHYFRLKRDKTIK